MQMLLVFAVAAHVALGLLVAHASTDLGLMDAMSKLDYTSRILLQLF